MKIITAKILRKHLACEGYDFVKFCKIFPKGAELTEENLRLAIKERLNLRFLAFRFLHTKNLKKFTTVYRKKAHIFTFWKKYLLEPLQKQKSFFRVNRRLKHV